MFVADASFLIRLLLLFLVSLNVKKECILILSFVFGGRFPQSWGSSQEEGWRLK